MKLQIFTDGACSGNPGPGGWAAIFALSKNAVAITGRELDTTNNRMELLAVVRSLSDALQKYQQYDVIEIHSDSSYVVNAITKQWLLRWKMNGWKTTTRTDVKNHDLWQQLDTLLIEGRKRGKQINFIKVKGHDGVLLNEMADHHAQSEACKAKKILEKEKV